jgi:hypothetical protein
MTNDITIAVVRDSENVAWLMLAQGRPAYEEIPDDGVEDIECGLYFSQLRHRVVVRKPDGSHRITTPSRVAAGEEVVADNLHHVGRMTGQPRNWALR